MEPSNTVSKRTIMVEKDNPWLTDGNVIFSCEGVAGFRVHTSVMVRHSEVFRNLFSDADPRTAATGCQVMEGCPVIELSDTREDCRNLLLALYGPISFKMRIVDDFFYLSSIPRSATKYCIDWLRNKAIAYLSRTWPHTLQGWLNVPDETKGDPIPHPALVIDLARKVDAAIFLRLALYRLGRLCKMTEDDSVESARSASPTTDSSYCLRHEDMENQARFQEHEHLWAQSFVEDCLENFPPAIACVDNERCLDSFRCIAAYARKKSVNPPSAPISFMDYVMEHQNHYEVDLCIACQKSLNFSVQERKHALWDSLPSWFGLPRWDVLTADFPEDEV